MDPLALCAFQAKAFWLLLGVGFSLLTLTWRLFQRKRYLVALLERERRTSAQKYAELLSNSSRQFAELQRSLLESFLREPTPTLRDLVERTEREWQARASGMPSDETIQLTTRDLIRR
jgi:hypothetical protein